MVASIPLSFSVPRHHHVARFDFFELHRLPLLGDASVLADFQGHRITARQRRHHQRIFADDSHCADDVIAGRKIPPAALLGLRQRGSKAQSEKYCQQRNAFHDHAPSGKKDLLQGRGRLFSQDVLGKKR